ncbi:MAG TPA: hypothetical protein VLN57_21025 [Xanthobacteraceae bacterium]|nr:hypothetical protein [Xanthobacteraceae bacterium]
MTRSIFGTAFDRYEHGDPALQTPGILPVPRLTAILTRTVNNSDLARVEILGPDGVPMSRRRINEQNRREHGTERAPTRCTACKELGHARSNKRCPRYAA